jgi:NADH dehydrogenase [ubiquinone] 1 alpha subcomplex assembly factor 6
LAFVPPAAQLAYTALRALNIEIARVADTVSTSHVGALRLQFWKDNVTKALDGQPPKHPVPVLLAAAQEDLRARSQGTARLSTPWLMRMISTREQYLNNNPYPSLEALESYAESTYSTLLYLTLQALPMASITADHIASHIGKATGIVTVLRGIPLLAFPPPPNHHSNNQGLAGGVQQERNRSQEGVVALPLDVMAEVGLREEDVLRQGAEAPGLKDVVFRVATRASDHLITARTMVQNLRAGHDVGHEFEHGEESEHRQGSQSRSLADQRADIEKAFGVFMPAVSTRLWLDRLQKVDFDIFHTELRRKDWKLPWKAWLAHRQEQF